LESAREGHEWSRKSNADYNSAQGISYSSDDAKPCGRADHFSADVLEIKIRAQKLLAAELKAGSRGRGDQLDKGHR